MRTIHHKAYGDPREVLELMDKPPPSPGADEVLVRVRAAGVNPADGFVVRGKPYMIRLDSGLPSPKGTLGMDLAGTVEAVGRKVTHFRPGDEVFGQGRGSFAEFAVASQRHLAPRPKNLTFEQAAAAPMAGLVALQALVEHGGVVAGQKVLITGAGGGIGTFAVQIARHLGAEVTAVASPSKRDLLESLGVDRIIDYTREDFTAGDVKYDFILDNAPGTPLAKARQVLTTKGTLIPNNAGLENRVVGSLPTMIGARLLSLFCAHRLRPFLSLPNPASLEELARLLENGAATPVLGRVFPLAQTAEALRLVESGHAAGKIVVSVVA